MQSLVLIICILVVLVAVGGLHLYTMKKLDTVQMLLPSDSKAWKELEKGYLASLYTCFMLFLFSLLIGVVLHEIVMFKLFLSYLTN